SPTACTGRSPTTARSTTCAKSWCARSTAATPPDSLQTTDTMTLEALKTRIESAGEARDNLDRGNAALRDDVHAANALLDSGQGRVAEPTPDGWQVNQWLKKAVLLYFRLHDNVSIDMGGLQGYDKVPLKYSGWSEAQFRAQGARVVPPAAVRKGA